MGTQAIPSSYEFWKLLSYGSAVIIPALGDDFVWLHGVSPPPQHTHTNQYSAGTQGTLTSGARYLLLPPPASSVLLVPAVLAAPDLASVTLLGSAWVPFFVSSLDFASSGKPGRGWDSPHFLLFSSALPVSQSQWGTLTSCLVVSGRRVWEGRLPLSGQEAEGSILGWSRQLSPVIIFNTLR